MEQFLYTHLSKKYGLKSLILQQAASVINSVRQYLRVDADVAMFAKCLKNECDQEFRVVQDIAKEQVYTALKTVLRERYPRSVEGEIAGTCDAMRGN